MCGVQADHARCEGQSTILLGRVPVGSAALSKRPPCSKCRPGPRNVGMHCLWRAASRQAAQHQAFLWLGLPERLLARNDAAPPNAND